MAITAEQQSAILKMAQAMFNATPGSVHLEGLGAEVEGGAKIANLAQALSGTALFLGKDYSSLTNATDFANKFVEDLLGDSVSAANKTVATNFIVGKMNAGATQNQVIAEVTGVLSGIPSTDPTWGPAVLHYNTANVTKLVDNLLGDQADASAKTSAVDLILAQMENGATFGEMVEWAYTALDRIDHADPVWGPAAALLDNRIEVSTYYSVEKQGKAVKLDDLQKILVEVTPNPTSVEIVNKQVDELLKDNPNPDPNPNPVDTTLKKIDLASLNGSNGFALVNDLPLDKQDDAKEISSISSAGDINGDGFDDVIVAVNLTVMQPYPDPSKSFGSSFVLFGKAGGFAATQPLTGFNGTNGVRLNGLRTGVGDSGGSVAVSDAGDINGDGIDDVLVTAPFISDDGVNYSSATRVVFGKQSGWDAVTDLPALNGNNGFSVTSDSMSTSFRSVSGIGDFNGDKIADILIGAPGAIQADGSTFGSSFIVFGKAGGFGKTLDVSALNGSNGFRLDDVETATSFGSQVSAGDINGDGIGDLIIGNELSGADETGSNASGAVYVVFGKAGGVGTTMRVDSLDGSNGFRLHGAVNDQVGVRVSNAGDINGDGTDDIVIGGNSQSNTMFVVFGKKGGGFNADLDLNSLNGSNGFKMIGIADEDGTIFRDLSGVGDFNKDGFDDLLVVGNKSGDNYLVYGKSSGFAATLALDQLDGTTGALLKGDSQSVNAAGDVNKDGYADVVLVGTTLSSQEAGQAYVVFGGVL